MTQRIIGIAGEIASGKSTVAEYLIGEMDAVSYKFSSPLRDVAQRLYLNETRDTLSTLSTVLRAAFGEDLLSKITAMDVEDSGADFVVIDGVRRETDIAYLKEIPGFQLWYITAPLELRYERITGRRENADDATKTFEDFKEDNARESEQQISALQQVADVVIENLGDVSVLQAEVRAAISD